MNENNLSTYFKIDDNILIVNNLSILYKILIMNEKNLC